jgi:hypothetical protein
MANNKKSGELASTRRFLIIGNVISIEQGWLAQQGRVRNDKLFLSL